MTPLGLCGDGKASAVFWTRWFCRFHCPQRSIRMINVLANTVKRSFADDLVEQGCVLRQGVDGGGEHEAVVEDTGLDLGSTAAAGGERIYLEIVRGIDGEADLGLAVAGEVGEGAPGEKGFAGVLGVTDACQKPLAGENSWRTMERVFFLE